MGMFSGIKEAREKAKALKREHLSKLAVEAVENGTYKFYYGYNSSEELQEVKEVVEEMNKELAQDKFEVRIISTYQASAGSGKIMYKKEVLGNFDYYILLGIDAL